jgi:hypothetical protein
VFCRGLVLVRGSGGRAVILVAVAVAAVISAVFPLLASIIAIKCRRLPDREDYFFNMGSSGLVLLCSTGKKIPAHLAERAKFQCSENDLEETEAL